MLAFLRGEGPPPARVALCVVLAPPRNCVIEALVDLGAAPPAVLGWKEVGGRARRAGLAGPAGPGLGLAHTAPVRMRGTSEGWNPRPA